MRMTRRGFIVAAGVAVVAVLVVALGLGLTGRYDRYFAVTLINGTGSPLTVDNHGNTVRLAAGQVDRETGSSTVHQPIDIEHGSDRHCVDLYFKRAPRRPLRIRLRGGRLAVDATRC